MQALDQQDGILDVISLPVVPSVVLEMLHKVFLFI